ncbi:PaaI family thioesterase [Actibacterium pelagium]|uniref:Thioesterase n=1 Tax=Actibacterium pelagium TaxID=2029103 RepID=A0A917AB29_9RHOB|nr:PaaI family thioesterase [Actibacterium pelagium]GGE39455.1 thioesterase [Actibacterium pelagium]
MTDDFKKIVTQFIESLPHARALGLQMVHLEDGVVELSMPYDEKLIGDPRTGVIHGGAVSALMDTCSGVAVVAHPERPVGTATIDLRIDYMRAANPNQTIYARAECYHMTRNVAFVRATTMDEDRDNPVATATGAFTVERLSEATK